MTKSQTDDKKAAAEAKAAAQEKAAAEKKAAAAKAAAAKQAADNSGSTDGVSHAELVKKIDRKIRAFNGQGKAAERALRASDVLSCVVREGGKSAGVVLIDGSKHEVEL